MANARGPGTKNWLYSQYLHKGKARRIVKCHSNAQAWGKFTVKYPGDGNIFEQMAKNVPGADHAKD